MNRREFTTGGSFALDIPTAMPAIWGEGQNVLWSSGEALMIVGPQGVGKTTLAQRLVLARCGIGSACELLSAPVRQSTKQKVLYIAADRPQQAARSLGRMVTQDDRELLDSRLLVWRGPLPFNAVADPSALARFAAEQGAGTVVVDSLKDIAVGLSDDKVGAAVGQTMQHVVAGGLELCVLHHQRKANTSNPKPATLADVYGSEWITASTGSVVLLWGQPGDAVVELRQLKQPASEVGPFEIVHDQRRGAVARVAGFELGQALESRPDGVTAKEAAQLRLGRNPNRNEVEKERRKLEALAEGPAVQRVTGTRDKDPVRYVPVKPREADREAAQELHAPSRQPIHTHHAPITAHHADGSPPPQPPLRGRRDPTREELDGDAELERLQAKWDVV